MRYTILEIYEEDYGCEGIPDGEEPMCSVRVRDDKGNEKLIRIADCYLIENKLDLGSILNWEE